MKALIIAAGNGTRMQPVTRGRHKSLMPLLGLKEFPIDVSIAVNMLGTKHIFTESQLVAKRIFNFFKSILFIYEIEGWIVKSLKSEDTGGWRKNRGFFTTLGKSMDIAIELSKKHRGRELECDLMITPDLPERKINLFTQFNPYYKLEPKISELYYEIGKKTALQYGPQINGIIAKKIREAEKQAVAV